MVNRWDNNNSSNNNNKSGLLPSRDYPIEIASLLEGSDREKLHHGLPTQPSLTEQLEYTHANILDIKNNRNKVLPVTLYSCVSLTSVR